VPNCNFKFTLQNCSYRLVNGGIYTRKKDQNSENTFCFTDIKIRLTMNAWNAAISIFRTSQQTACSVRNVMAPPEYGGYLFYLFIVKSYRIVQN